MLKIAASSGIAMTPPRKRGITTRRTGSTAIISIAEIWSVARISPSSEASAVPARPANRSAVTTGPSSLRSPSAAAVPSDSSDPKRSSRSKPCRPSTMPTNSPDSMMITSDSAPALWTCSTTRRKRSSARGVSAASRPANSA